MPNIPHCAADDLLNWVQLYRPERWATMFPIVTDRFEEVGVDCPDHPLWASVYALAQTPVMRIADFVLYNTQYYEDFLEWISKDAKYDECVILRAPDLIYGPAIGYVLFSCWGYILWASRLGIKVVQTVIYMASTTYAVTKD